VFANREHFAISSAGTQPGRIQPIGLNEVCDWLNGADRQMSRAALVQSAKGRGAKVAAVLLVLAAAAFGVRMGVGRLASASAQRNEQRLVRLEQAGRLYNQGQRDTVIELLRSDH
jgi:hypothetical protein